MTRLRAPQLLALVAFLTLGFPTLGCHDLSFHPRDFAGDIDIYDDLFTVSVAEADHIVAAGYWGAIYVSENGGDTWVKADSGTDGLLYDVSMANATHGWVVGQLGLILRTEDGGRTWKRQDNPKVGEVHLFSIQALDARRAWAVGEWGTRIYTDDGGASWKDFSLTVDEAHPQFVWLSVFDQDRVRRGEKVFEDVGLNDVSCLPSDPDRCWIIGEFGYIFRTTTGGVNEEGGNGWESGAIVSGMKVDPIEMGYNVIEIPEAGREQVMRLAEEISAEEHLNIAIEPRVTRSEIEAFGGADDPYPLFEILEARTQEVQTIVEEAGILSDRIRRRGAPPWDYEDFIEEDPEFLDRYYESRESDVAGVEVQISQNPVLFTVRFRDAENGMVSGLGGVILKSTDGGATWSYENVGNKRALFAVQPLANRAITVGEKGFARVSVDGGATWTEPPGFPTLFTFMRDLAFDRDGRVGFIVGERGMVLRSEDSGQTWKRVLPPPDRIRGA